MEKRPESLLHIYLSALSVEASSIVAIMHYAYNQVMYWILQSWEAQNDGTFCLDLSAIIRIGEMYLNDLKNIKNAQFGDQDEQNGIRYILEQRLL